MPTQISIDSADELTLSNGASVRLRHSARARRIRLTVSAQGEAELVLPRRVSLREALAFAESKRDWLARHSGTRRALASAAEVAVAPDDQGRPTTIPLRGVPTSIGWGEAADIQLARSHGVSDLLRWLKAAARADAQISIDALTPALGCGPSALTIRDQKTLWGSLSGSNRLSLNWRLVMAPPTVLHYVVAHEMAHLLHRNHSARFWALCEQLDPQTQASRQWLRLHGDRLRMVLPAD